MEVTNARNIIVALNVRYWLTICKYVLEKLGIKGEFHTHIINKSIEFIIDIVCIGNENALDAV